MPELLKISLNHYLNYFVSFTKRLYHYYFLKNERSMDQRFQNRQIIPKASICPSIKVFLKDADLIKAQLIR